MRLVVKTESAAAQFGQDMDRLSHGVAQPSAASLVGTVVLPATYF
jgi:hypothetical protein